MEAKKTSTFVLVTLVIMLTGCTAPPLKTEPASIEKTKKPLPPPNNTPPIPCVYESTKGVAEVIQITPDQVAFKFYPGDQMFYLPISDLNDTDISLNQELKAIIRIPLSGPCRRTEFELISTVK